MPTWLFTLARRLEGEGNLAPKHILGPLTAVRELRAAAAAVTVGRGMVSKEDRNSLRNDVYMALTSLGPKVCAAAEPHLGAIRCDLDRLHDLLAAADGAIVLRSLCDAVLVGWADRSLAVAAWQDTREAFESSCGDPELCELRIRQLAELSKLQGHDWTRQASLARGVLLNDRFALAEIGRVPPPRPEDLHDPAGVDLWERLELLETVFLQTPPTGDVVGWVCFANALLRQGVLQVGPITVMGHQAWPGTMEAPADAGTVHPELQDPDCSLFFCNLPPPPFVLMRVPLGQTGVGGAGELVRQVTSDLVRVAQWTSEWRLVPGAALFVQAEHSGWFGRPIRNDPDPRVNRFSAEFEPTGDALSDLAEPLVAAVLSGRSHSHDAVMDVEWAQAVAAIPDAAQRIALGLRLIERGLPAPGGDHWTAAVTRYLKGWWVRRAALECVSGAAHAIVDVLESPIPLQGVVEPWRERLTPRSGPTGYIVRLDETIRALPEALKAMPEGTMQYRVAVAVTKRTRDAASWQRFRAELASEFDVLVGRAARQRNAVIHGADTVATTVASVAEFVSTLQAMVVRAELDALVTGDDLLTHLEGARMEAEREQARLAAGEALAFVLFGTSRPTGHQAPGSVSASE
jgi:hypothetical protein